MSAVPQSVLQAAHTLITSLGARPQMHSVWIETGVDPAGAFKYHLNCSIHPKAPAAVRGRVPDEVGGYPVVVVPWPSSMV